MTFRQTVDTDPMVNYLISGHWRDEGRLPFSFQPGRTITVNLTGLDATGQALARAALEAWEMVTDVTFRESSLALFGIRFTDDNGSNNAFTQFPEPGDQTGHIAWARVNISQSWLDSYGTTVGSYSFHTYVHEIGHALGIGHAGNYEGGGFTWPEGSRFPLTDSYQYSIMSYYGQDENPNTNGATRASAIGPQTADILAMQKIYGAPGADGVTQGDTVWGVGSNLDNYLGDYFKAYKLGAVLPYGTTFTIYDQGGTDLVDLSFHGRDQVINLLSGGISDVLGLKGNMFIAQGTVIENVNAGRGNDMVQGNDVANRIDGGVGMDRIWGLAGRDVLIGGNSDDQLIGGGGMDRLDGGHGNDRLTGGGERDTFVFYRGEDRITDFNGRETILLDRTMWGTSGVTGEAILNAHADRVGGNLVFDFGRYGTLTLEGVTSTAGLADNIGLY